MVSYRRISSSSSFRDLANNNKNNKSDNDNNKENHLFYSNNTSEFNKYSNGERKKGGGAVIVESRTNPLRRRRKTSSYCCFSLKKCYCSLILIFVFLYFRQIKHRVDQMRSQVNGSTPHYDHHYNNKYKQKDDVNAVAPRKKKSNQQNYEIKLPPFSLEMKNRVFSDKEEDAIRTQTFEQMLKRAEYNRALCNNSNTFHHEDKDEDKYASSYKKSLLKPFGIIDQLKKYNIGAKGDDENFTQRENLCYLPPQKCGKHSIGSDNDEFISIMIYFDPATTASTYSSSANDYLKKNYYFDAKSLRSLFLNVLGLLAMPTVGEIMIIYDNDDEEDDNCFLLCSEPKYGQRIWSWHNDPNHKVKLIKSKTIRLPSSSSPSEFNHQQIMPYILQPKFEYVAWVVLPYQNSYEHDIINKTEQVLSSSTNMKKNIHNYYYSSISWNIEVSRTLWKQDPSMILTTDIFNSEQMRNQTTAMSMDQKSQTTKLLCPKSKTYNPVYSNHVFTERNTDYSMILLHRNYICLLSHPLFQPIRYYYSETNYSIKNSKTRKEMNKNIPLTKETDSIYAMMTNSNLLLLLLSNISGGNPIALPKLTMGEIKQYRLNHEQETKKAKDKMDFLQDKRVYLNENEKNAIFNKANFPDLISQKDEFNPQNLIEVSSYLGIVPPDTIDWCKELKIYHERNALSQDSNNYNSDDNNSVRIKKFKQQQDNIKECISASEQQKMRSIYNHFC